MFKYYVYERYMKYDQVKSHYICSCYDEQNADDITGLLNDIHSTRGKQDVDDVATSDKYFYRRIEIGDVSMLLDKCVSVLYKQNYGSYVKCMEIFLNALKKYPKEENGNDNKNNVK